MELLVTETGVVTLAVMAVLFVYFARNSSLGALSLPCVTILTTIVYFYLMPALAFSAGELLFLGVYLDTMVWVHIAAFLYIIGVAVAGFAWKRQLKIDPSAPRWRERPLNIFVFWSLVVIALAGLVALTLVGRLNLTAAEEFEASANANSLAFLQLSISMLLPLSVVYAVRDNFGLRSIAILLLVSFVFLVAGFRFRIAILAIALAICFCMSKNIKIRPTYVAIGAILSISLFNLIGQIRQYGVGIDLKGLDGISWSDLLVSFGGEVGPIFALYSVTNYPPPDLIGADPWVIAIARLIPTFIWPEKPYPYYLSYYTIAFDQETREKAGIAGPQQAEILLQFGWVGLPILAFLYFSVIFILSRWLNRSGREVRMAGAALIPGVFGFYMQQRGYFFQNVLEGLFIIGPLFLMDMRARVPPLRSLWDASAKPARVER